MSNITSKHQIYIRLPEAAAAAAAPTNLDPNVIGFNFRHLSGNSVITVLKNFMKFYISAEDHQHEYFINRSPKEIVELCKSILTIDVENGTVHQCVQLLQPLQLLSQENHSGITLIDLHDTKPKYSIFIPGNLHSGIDKINIDEKNVLRLLNAQEYLELFHPKILEGLFWNSKIEKFVPMLIKDKIQKLTSELDINNDNIQLSKDIYKIIDNISFLKKIETMTQNNLHDMFLSAHIDNKISA